MPSSIIKKIALASALRLYFSDLLAGLYASEEMDQAGFDRPEPVAREAANKAAAPAPAPPAPETDPVESLEAAFAGKQAERKVSSEPSPEPVSRIVFMLTQVMSLSSQPAGNAPRCGALLAIVASCLTRTSHLPTAMHQRTVSAG